MTCPHIHLSKKKVGVAMIWWACDQCGQKFLCEEWDGQMKVVPSAEKSSESK